MAKLTRDSLLTLEAYARARADMRSKVLEHKKNRKVPLGAHVTLLFEDEQTVRYQVQEMLRIERIFEDEGIQHELDAYNPLIPDGTNLKATMLIEYEDVEQRRRELARLVGIEDRVWVRVDGGEKVYAIADEDLDRSTEEKTSAVHFLRFELDPTTIAALKAGAALGAGVDHQNYPAQAEPLPDAVRDSLAADLA
ncbi:MAG: DUF3501 family protein [Burkholderiaceae bacterium]|nr:DUF3501 family protein [Burkholderiaceae bacterium]